MSSGSGRSNDGAAATAVPSAIRPGGPLPSRARVTTVAAVTPAALTAARGPLADTSSSRGFMSSR